LKIGTKRDLGAIVREHRRRAGFSQEQLADLAGVRRRWVVELEKGQSNPTFEPLLRVFEALGLSLHLESVPAELRDTPSTWHADVDLDLLLDRHRGPER
jgi:HTH-type transcriptional regulator/antitoxin HipB